MNRSSLAFATIAIAVCTLSGSPLVNAEDEVVRRISVTGHGEASGAPDTATVIVGVVAQAANADEAVEQNNQVAARLFERLRAAGIAEKDMQTSSFDVQPQYAQQGMTMEDQRSQRLPEIVGYRVSNQVRVRTRKLDQLGSLLDEVVRAGSNQIFGIDFSVADSKPLADQAKQRAVEDAQRVAKLYADAAGVELRGLVSLSERVESGPRPMPYARAMMAESSVPIAAGEHNVEATVHAEYEFAPR